MVENILLIVTLKDEKLSFTQKYFMILDFYDCFQNNQLP